MDDDHTPQSAPQKADPTIPHNQLNHPPDKQFLREQLTDDAESSSRQKGAVAVSMVIVAAFATTLLFAYLAADKFFQLLRFLFS